MISLIKLFINSGIESEFAHSLAKFGKSMNEISNHWLYERKDNYWRSSGCNLLFNNIIKLFSLAGFNNGVILFDELEKVFPPLNRLERKSFV